MFKKPLGNTKTSAPLRSSDRRKLKQRVAQTFALDSDAADILVPDGILAMKYSTHTGENGMLYLSPDSTRNPLWFTVGKGTDELVPTVYTLWKQPTLLPTLSTPSAVIPILIGGADLMIPGVVHIPHTQSLQQNALVSITQYQRSLNVRGPPLAVGRMALDATVLAESANEDRKGRAVYVLHTWKDHLWAMGKGGDVPPAVEVAAGKEAVVEDESGEEEGEDVIEEKADESVLQAQEEEHSTTEIIELKDRRELESTDGPTVADPTSVADPTFAPSDPLVRTLSPEDVSTLLRTALLQALSTALSKLPSSAFPIPATTFYTSHILPFRPSNVPVVSSTSSPPSNVSSRSAPLASDAEPSSESVASSSTPAASVTSAQTSPQTPIDIKHSSHKSLSHFLRTSERAGLLRLKDARPDAAVVSVNSAHADVLAHKKFRTVKDAEEKKKRTEAREKENTNAGGDIQVERLWKPTGAGVKLFEGAGLSTSTLYTRTDLKNFLSSYFTTHDLVSHVDQQYIDTHADAALRTVLSSKPLDSSGSGSGSGSATSQSSTGTGEWARRDDVLDGLCARMQAWYRIEKEGEEPITRKGIVRPISVIVKARRNKAVTLILGIEPFLLSPTAIADALRARCQSSTSVSPAPDRKEGEEVMVQGKQSKAALDILLAHGVPKRWIEVADMDGKKKK